MNMINKTLTIAASTLLLTAVQTTHADSLGEPFTDTTAEAFAGPAITLAVTPNSDSVMATVSYTEENLESEEGVREFYKLLQRASKNVCSGETLQHRRNVIMKSSQLRCYRQSLSNAVSEIDNESLTSFHSG